MEQNPYELADKAIELLNKKAVRRFNEAQSKAALAKFDELTIIGLTKELYESLAQDNQDTMLELAQMVYRQTKPHGSQIPVVGWLLDFFMAYNPVMKYVYQHEIDRKRQYTAEGINSAKDKPKEFQRGLMYWSRMTDQMCIEVTDAARLKAFEDAGVKWVVWHTEHDEKVCEECEPRDGKVYPIDNIPSKTHWGCRCWFTIKE